MAQNRKRIDESSLPFKGILMQTETLQKLMSQFAERVCISYDDGSEKVRWRCMFCASYTCKTLKALMMNHVEIKHPNEWKKARKLYYNEIDKRLEEKEAAEK